jgi:nitrite reductase (NADH) small subunit
MTVATWTPVCRIDVLQRDRGVAALVDGEPVAIFLVTGVDDVLAIGNIDPFSGASVLSRGIVGSKGDALTVAAPVYKQRFDLRTGRCLDDETVAVPTYTARVADGWVEVLTS